VRTVHPRPAHREGAIQSPQARNAGGLPATETFEAQAGMFLTLPSGHGIQEAPAGFSDRTCSWPRIVREQSRTGIDIKRRNQDELADNDLGRIQIGLCSASLAELRVLGPLDRRQGLYRASGQDGRLRQPFGCQRRRWSSIRCRPPLGLEAELSSRPQMRA
jgi:hypothetical protein